MALDTSIPLQVQTVNPVGMLSSVLGIQNQQAQLQGQQQQNQQGAIDLQETQAAQSVIKNAPRDASGNVDLDAVSPLMAQAAPKNYAKFMQNLAGAQQAAITAKQSWSDLADSTRQKFGKVMTSLVGQKPDTIASTFQELSKQPEFQAGLPAIQHFWVAAVKPALQSGNQQEIDDAMYRVGKMGETASTQQGMNTPGGVTVSDGASTKVVSTKPGATVPAGQVVPGTAATLRPGPTTPTVDQAGTQGIVGTPTADFTGVQGPQRNAILADIAAREPGSDVAREANNALTGRPQGFIPQSLPAGQAQNIANNVDEMNRHFSSLNDAASGAALQQGLIGNIKALAPQAATGTGAGRKAFVSGLLAAMHIPDTGDEAKNTDLLEKNMAQLNLSSPASTDAMRTIVNAARPHGTMQKDAIIEAADQLSGQISANMAIRNALQGYKMMGDVQGYANARQKLEQIADPRVFQFEAADAAGRTRMLANLTPDDKAQLRTKIQAAEEMGLVK